MSPESSIFSTILYFDIFGFPLTREEVFKYLWQGKLFNQEEIEKHLDILVKNGKLGVKSGYYFLPQREKDVEKRLRAVVPSEDKLKRARFAVKFIKWIPFLRAVYVCNSVSAETANSKSDIDFFIVTAERRLWFVRAGTNLFLKLFGLRTGRHSADKICLSFFVGEEHLNLGEWRVCRDDVYLTYWLMQLLPIYDPKNLLVSIYAANSWAAEYVTFGAPTVGSAKNNFGIIKRFGEFCLGGKIGAFAEKICMSIQWKMLRPELKQLAEKNSCDVVLTDGVLKLHEKDARRNFHDMWLKNSLTYVE